MVVLMAIPPDRNMHSDKPSTSTSDGRKSSKPIMEKRRRARINASLTELKSLLLEVIKKEGTRYNKMEKADILEMTVKHLRQLQRQQFTGSPKTDSNVLNNYRCGFDKCAQEVTSYLAQMEVCDVDLRSRILSHLANCVSSGIFNPSPPCTPVSVIAQSMSPPSQACASSPTLSLPAIPASSSQPLIYNQLPLEQPSRNLDFNLPGTDTGASQPVQMTKIVSGVQVIPTKLHTGEIAFVLPGNVLSSGGQVPSYIIPVYPSQATDNPQLQTISSSTVISPAVISPLPFIHAGQDTLKSHTVPDVLLSSVPRQFVNVTTGHHSVVQTPTISQYPPNVAMLTPRPTPPSSTVTSQRLPIEERPLLIQDANNDQNHVQMPRQDPQRDDSMWRPW